MSMSDKDRPDGEAENPFDQDGGQEPETGEESGFDGDSEANSPFDDESTPFDQDSAASNEELDLGDDDGRLPWLEGDDDDFEEGGYNTAQLAMAVLLGLLVLALVVGGIWWATRTGPDPDLVADGGVIEAPDAPYKERPDDPGGKTFEGTGDTSFAVSDGQTRPVQLGDGETPAPGFETIDGPQASATPSPKPSASPSASASEPAAQPTPAAGSGPGVQVGAYSTRASAESGWNRLKEQYSALSGMRYRIVEGQADIGTVYRVQALPGDKAAADSLCRNLRSAGLNCHVKD